ncbi:MAG: imidazole glycerol phosphate synthase subunit HisH [Limnochordaceae bacterium]|nr:imidazole glycerol phosphate synthase subunit HisH [Limnochordaceae bacterium]
MNELRPDRAVAPLDVPGRIGLVDYGMGNLASVERALVAVARRAEVVRVTAAAALDGVQAVVLPGVGAFEAAMRSLRELGLDRGLRAYLDAGRPLLGICLGYQILFEAGEESAREAGGAGALVPGLGYFPGVVRRFPPGVTVPHMGWNRLELTGTASPLFQPGDASPYVYFAHSYYPEPQQAGVVTAWCRVGAVRFAAAAWRGRAGGVQFHPEKSGATGLSLLRRFVGWALGAGAEGDEARGATVA